MLNHQINLSFRNKIRAECFDHLADVGFVRYRKENADWPLDNEFHAWIGLNEATFSDYFELNPFVGIHVVPIMKMYTSYEGRKYARTTATYAVHVGQLPEVSEFPAFHFIPSMPDYLIKSEARRLAELLSVYGVNFSRGIASYEALLPLLRERVPSWGGYPEKYASCLFLMGRVDDAEQFTRQFYEEAPDYFSAFAEPFLKSIEVGRKQDKSNASK